MKYDGFERWDDPDMYEVGYRTGYKGIQADPSPALSPDPQSQNRFDWILGYIDGLADAGFELRADGVRKFYEKELYER